jgi:hypothetical protein
MGVVMQWLPTKVEYTTGKVSFRLVGFTLLSSTVLGEPRDGALRHNKMYRFLKAGGLSGKFFSGLSWILAIVGIEVALKGYEVLNGEGGVEIETQETWGLGQVIAVVMLGDLLAETGTHFYEKYSTYIEEALKPQIDFLKKIYPIRHFLDFMRTPKES